MENWTCRVHPGALLQNTGLTRPARRGMARSMIQNQKSFAGGILITLCLLIGAAIGIAFGQPSAGFVGGLATGSLVALALAVRDKRRGR